MGSSSHYLVAGEIVMALERWIFTTEPSLRCPNHNNSCDFRVCLHAKKIENTCCVMKFWSKVILFQLQVNHHLLNAVSNHNLVTIWGVSFLICIYIMAKSHHFKPPQTYVSFSYTHHKTLENPSLPTVPTNSFHREGGSWGSSPKSQKDPDVLRHRRQHALHVRQIGRNRLRPNGVFGAWRRWSEVCFLNMAWREDASMHWYLSTHLYIYNTGWFQNGSGI